MRPRVLQFALAYGAGLWTGLVFLVPLAVVLVITALALVVAARGAWGRVVVAAGACGGLTGMLARGAGSTACAVGWNSGPQTAWLHVHDAPGARGLTTGTVLHAAGGCGGRLRLRLDPGSVPAGARIVAVGTYRKLDRGGGVFRIWHGRVLPGRRSWRHTAREAVEQRLTVLYGERAPLVNALIIGRREDLDRRLRQTFADSGLAHLLAISGLHVGIVASWVQWLARLVTMRRRAALLSALFAWGYVAFLGFPAPATRSAAFLTMAALSLLRQRHPPATAVLVTAALVVVAVDPLAAADVGAWLSFAAVWGSDLGARWLKHRRSPVLRSLAVSTGATLATAPITAYAFGAVALIGIAANLVAIPLAAVAVPGVFASLLLGAPVAGGAGLALAGMEWTARVAAHVPGGRVTGAPGLGFAMIWLAVLACVVWVLSVRPRWVLSRRGVLLGAAAASWMYAAMPLMPSCRGCGGGGGEVEIHVLDVGQGDAIAVRTPSGRWLLIDGGPRTAREDAGRRVVVPFFRSRGVRALDLVIVSHGDADHVGGVPAVVRALEPDLVVEPGQPLESALYQEHLATVDQHGAIWQAARSGDTLRIDGIVLAVLHPSAPWITTQLEPNENSVVIRLVYGGFEALFTGDVGAVVESALGSQVGEADLLKVGHHGSAGSTTAAWLDAVRPRAAVISVGANRYGHPDPGVVHGIEQRGIALFRTDRGGAVTVRSNGSYFEVVQGGLTTTWERLACRLRPWLRSNASSFSRNACTPARRASFPTSSTTSR